MSEPFDPKGLPCVTAHQLMVDQVTTDKENIAHNEERAVGFLESPKIYSPRSCLSGTNIMKELSPSLFYMQHYEEKGPEEFMMESPSNLLQIDLHSGIEAVPRFKYS